MMWVAFNLTLRRFAVSGYGINHIRPKTIIASLTRWDRKSNDMAHPLRANKKFDFEFISSLFAITPKPFLVLICVWLNFIEVVGSPVCIFHVIVPDEIGNDRLEYMGVQILDSISARMRQQPEDVDHLHCSHIKTSRQVAIQPYVPCLNSSVVYNVIKCSRGPQHLPVSAASACRTVSHALWWQHNYNLVFWTHDLTSTQKCSII